jgi:pSer/pThr/pTyr-binding forkhead associated (FHA) protein
MSQPILSLSVLNGHRKGVRFDVEARGALVGRLDECDLTLPDGTVSSHHARIQWSGAQWMFEDLNSTNHSLLNGERVMPGRAVPLPARGRLTFGDVGVAFEALRPAVSHRPDARADGRAGSGPAPGYSRAAEVEAFGEEVQRLRQENQSLRAQVGELETALQKARQALASLQSAPPPSAPQANSSSGGGAPLQALELLDSFGNALDQLSASAKRLKKTLPDSAEVEEIRAKARECILRMADLSSLLRS